MAILIPLVVLCAAVAPADAIIGGEPDGNAHPNVGAIIMRNANNEYLGHCTGTLISPTVVLTAAHCLDPKTWLPDVVAAFKVNFYADLRDPATCAACRINATPYYDPRWDATQKKGNGTSQFLLQTDYDLAIVVLDYPASDVYPGITPAPIVGLGGLNQFGTGTRNRYFTDVGYGLQRELTPPANGGLFVDFTRNVAVTPLHKLTALRLELQGNSRDNRGTGGICSGDSGGPTFMDATVVAVHSYGQVNNADICNNVSGNVRIDTESARSFLGQFVALP